MRKNIFGNEQTVSPNFLNIYFRRSDVGEASAARTRAMTAVKGKGRVKKPAAEKLTMSATDQSQAKTTRASRSAGRVTQMKGTKPAMRRKAAASVSEPSVSTAMTVTLSQPDTKKFPGYAKLLKVLSAADNLEHMRQLMMQTKRCVTSAIVPSSRRSQRACSQGHP